MKQNPRGSKLKKILVVLAMMFGVASAAEWKEGTQYKIVNPAGKSPTPVVLEIFSYGCPHCYEADPMIEEWLKTKPANVKFERVAAFGFNPQWDVFARVFYTAQALGLSDKTHHAVFSEIHVKGKRSWSEDDVVKFFVGFGKDEKTVRATMNGFHVQSKLNQSKALLKKYKITGVPSFVVNDKYFTDFRMGGADAFKVINDLAAKK
jgi:thiol:disulfide interchange protein DsbA